MKYEKWLSGAAGVLVVVGAVNWGLVAFNANVIASVFGTGVIAKIVYGLVGVAGIYHVPVVWKQLRGR